MNEKFITLNRDEIVTIGPRQATVTIKQYQDDNVINIFEVYNCRRRKNILFCYAFNGQIRLTFENIKRAIYYTEYIRKLLKESLRRVK